MEAVKYKIVSSKKGITQRERMSIIDNEIPLTLSNIEVLVNACDDTKVKFIV